MLVVTYPPDALFGGTSRDLNTAEFFLSPCTAAGVFPATRSQNTIIGGNLVMTHGGRWLATRVSRRHLISAGRPIAPDSVSL